MRFSGQFGLVDLKYIGRQAGDSEAPCNSDFQLIVGSSDSLGSSNGVATASRYGGRRSVHVAALKLPFWARKQQLSATLKKQCAGNSF